MALSGSFTHIWSELNNDVTQSIDVTYPADLPSNDPNYDKRGTTVQESVPTQVEHSQSYSDVYIHIQGASIYNKEDNVGDKGKSCSIVYKVFNSEGESHTEGAELVRADYTFDWDFATMTNPYSEGYDMLKTLDGMDNLINA
jgi:hypothetical protein